MNYSELTYFQINMMVFKMSSIYEPWDTFVDNKLPGRDYILCHDGDSWHEFDPCNNPSDAWPIIEEIWDELMREEFRGCGVTVWKHVMEEYKCSKLRAAMICFLSMDEC